MKTVRNFLALAIAIFSLSAVSISAQSYAGGSRQASKTIEQQIFKKLISLPRYGVFDFINYKVENGTVTVSSGLGDEECVTVTEDSASSATFTGRIKLQPAKTSTKRDNVLQFQPDTTINASHGFGYLGRHATLKP